MTMRSPFFMKANLLWGLSARYQAAVRSRQLLLPILPSLGAAVRQNEPRPRQDADNRVRALPNMLARLRSSSESSAWRDRHVVCVGSVLSVAKHAV